MIFSWRRMHGTKAAARSTPSALCALLAAVACAVLIGGCGGSGRRAGSTLARDAANPPASASTAPLPPAVDADKDNDVAEPTDDVHHDRLVPFGHTAGEAYSSAIAIVVKRYYAAALAGDGAKACSLLYSPFAESTPYTYGSGPAGLPYAHGTTCRAVLKNFFAHIHARLAADVPKLTVVRVVLREHRGVAVLGFGPLERQIPVQREGAVWRIGALIDQELP